MASGAFPRGGRACLARGCDPVSRGARVDRDPSGSLCTPGGRVERTTTYDLASLTKILCTTTLTAVAVSQGLARLSDPVPEPWSKNIPGATLADLLEHSSGLAAHREYFTEVTPYDRDAVVRRVCATPPLAAPREQAVYSDLGFIVLGCWLERLFDKPLELAFDDVVAFRLALESSPLPQLGFRKIYGLPRLDVALEPLIAPTEVYDEALHPGGVPSHFAVRREVLCAHGAVHDDNAFVMGGVAGHAGLFGSAQGVLSVAIAWARCSLSGLSRGVRDRFWVASSVSGSTRRLGFDGPSPDGAGSAGSALLASAVGHTGYTGTSLWIDHEAAGGPRIYVLLTNRVSPGPDERCDQGVSPQVPRSRGASISRPRRHCGRVRRRMRARSGRAGPGIPPEKRLHRSARRAAGLFPPGQS